MKPLTIEIHGTGTHNRGAELMAIAIGERIRSTFPGARIAVARHFGPPEALRSHGFLADARFLGALRARLLGRVLLNVGPTVRRSLGVVHPREIDVVLDASGFAFSDQWGPRAANFLVAKMNNSERAGKPLILLSQALGPFSDPEVARAARALFDRAALVCARDEQSYAAAQPLLDPGKLRRYPDFTLAAKPVYPPGLGLPKSFSAIVPNCRMLDKTEEAEEYLTFLGATIQRLEDAGLHPVFVRHGGVKDRMVIERVQTRKPVDLIEHADPRVLKGILSRAELVVGSRFHALVSALSHGVPCIGVGWSHKYPELFRDFDVPELVVSDLADGRMRDEVLDRLERPEARARFRERIQSAGDELREQSDQMWREVEAVIRAQVPAAS